MNVEVCSHGTPANEGCGACAAAGIGVVDSFAPATTVTCSHGLSNHVGCDDPSLSIFVDGPNCTVCSRPVRMAYGMLLQLPANATVKHPEDCTATEAMIAKVIVSRRFEVQVSMREVKADGDKEVLADFTVEATAPTAALGYASASALLSERWNQVSSFVHLSDQPAAI